MQKIDRRGFLHDSMLIAAAAAVSTTVPMAGLAQEKNGKPSNRIRVAILGCGIRGKQHAEELKGVADCEIVYVCDPDHERSAALTVFVEKQQGSKPKAVADMRRIFDDGSVDAVFIATPNHWHALAAIWAMQSGKDVYVEKPVSHTVTEGRRIVETARKTERICQGGTQNRSDGGVAAAVRFMKEGKLGEVRLARSIVYRRRDSIGGPGRYEIPASVDYNLFAGPAPLAPLTRPKFHYDWHWFWDTGNGELGNNNIHSLDICRWGLGVSGLGRSVLSYGGRFGYKDAAQTPNTQVVIYDFDHQTIVSETRGLPTGPFKPQYKGDWIFEGTKGFISGTSLFDLDGKLVSTFTGKKENHFANFLNAVRSRKRDELNADILETHQSTALCHVGNISWRLGQPATSAQIRDQLAKLKAHDNLIETLDRTEQHLRDNKVDLAGEKLILGQLLLLKPARESFAHNKKADALLKREYRKPFVVPG